MLRVGLVVSKAACLEGLASVSAGQLEGRLVYVPQGQSERLLGGTLVARAWVGGLA